MCGYVDMRAQRFYVAARTHTHTHADLYMLIIHWHSIFILRRQNLTSLTIIFLKQPTVRTRSSSAAATAALKYWAISLSFSSSRAPPNGPTSVLNLDTLKLWQIGFSRVEIHQLVVTCIAVFAGIGLTVLEEGVPKQK